MKKLVKEQLKEQHRVFKKLSNLFKLIDRIDKEYPDCQIDMRSNDYSIIVSILTQWGRLIEKYVLELNPQTEVFEIIKVE